MSSGAAGQLTKIKNKLEGGLHRVEHFTTSLKNEKGKTGTGTATTSTGGVTAGFSFGHDSEKKEIDHEVQFALAVENSGRLDQLNQKFDQLMTLLQHETEAIQARYRMIEHDMEIIANGLNSQTEYTKQLLTANHEDLISIMDELGASSDKQAKSSSHFKNLLSFGKKKKGLDKVLQASTPMIEIGTMNNDNNNNDNVNNENDTENKNNENNNNSNNNNSNNDNDNNNSNNTTNDNNNNNASSAAPKMRVIRRPGA